MGKYSNILLLDENDIIIDSFKHFSTNNGASRNILPKHKYSSPSSNKIDISNFEELINNINNLDDSCIIDFFCNNFIGLSKTSVKQLIAEKNISTSLDDYTLLANCLLELQNNIKNSHIKCISVENNDYALTYSQSIIPLQVNTFLDNYYNNKQENEQFLSYKNTLLSSIVSKLKKLSKKLSNINEKLEECSQMEKYKLYGELITSNLYQISKQRLSHIELLNYYDGTTIDIPLDISLYPNDNAKKYFKKYNKLKATNDIVQIQKIELEKESEKVEYVKPLEKENKMVAEVNTKEPTGTPVKSPIVGVFYSASSPESDPYVTVGKTVKKGDIVCIIEAMKVMNEIKAPCDGTVTSILVENEALVEYDQALMVIEENV